ncbi:hypothetical protein D3C72_682000 [compost metagenome]
MPVDPTEERESQGDIGRDEGNMAPGRRRVVSESAGDGEPGDQRTEAEDEGAMAVKKGRREGGGDRQHCHPRQGHDDKRRGRPEWVDHVEWQVDDGHDRQGRHEQVNEAPGDGFGATALSDHELHAWASGRSTSLHYRASA